jgi:general secretion pathway protein K
MIRRLARVTYRVIDALDRPPRAPDARRGRPRGIAMVIALMTIAILSAAVVQYTYSTRVNLTMSVNAKDKLKSYFLARSGANLSRLLLNLQYALQSEADEAADSEDQAAGGSCNPQMISVAMRRSNFQMHQYVNLLMRPFNSGKLETPVGGINLAGAGVEGFGGISGDFQVDVAPESGKFNVNEFARAEVREQDVKEFCTLVSDSQYTELFAGESPSGRQDGELRGYDIMRNIIDYIDLNQTRLPITEYCTLEEGRGGGDEGQPYSDNDRNIEPRNAKLTHVAELYQVHGVDDGFMEAFGDQLTVYPVGKPNANMATAPVFYSVLCRNVQLTDNANVSSSARGVTPCQQSREVALQVLYFAMALDGVRNFFKDPLSVLMAYVGSTESRLLPSAKRGQPVAFLQSSQVHSYLEDFRAQPQIMAQFITYSPTYRKLASQRPDQQLDPRSPNFPDWAVQFDRTGILRAMTTETPSIYRIKSTGTYGSTKTTVEAVVDFNKPIRRLPNEQQLEQRETDSEELKSMKEALNKRRETMPKGRIYFWRENIVDTGGGGGGSGASPSEQYDAPGSEDERDREREEGGFGDDEGFGGDDGFGEEEGLGDDEGFGF